MEEYLLWGLFTQISSIITVIRNKDLDLHIAITMMESVATIVIVEKLDNALIHLIVATVGRDIV